MGVLPARQQLGYGVLHGLSLVRRAQPRPHVHHPHYRALLLRKTYADLSLPDAIMDRAISWWDGVEGARFNHADKTCYFPSGARVSFGYLASARDHLRYQGAAVHFVGIDEASQIPSRQLEYLHSRIRRAIDDPIPLRYRLASNPGDLSQGAARATGGRRRSHRCDVRSARTSLREHRRDGGA